MFDHLSHWLAITWVGIYQVTAGKSFISFTSFSNVTEDVITVYHGESISWDAAWPHMSRFVLLGNHSINITFRCNVEILRPVDKLYDMDFIFHKRKLMSSKWYTKLHKTYNQTRMPVRLDRRDIFADIKFGKDGGIVSLVNIPPHKSLDDIHFHCVTRNRRGQMTSNAVELFDYRWRFVSRMRTVDEPKTLIDRTTRKTFLCLDPPLRTDPFIVVRYDWSVCGGQSEGCKSVLELDPSWRAQVLPNGTLYWSFVPDSVVRKLQGKKLVCSVGGQTMVTYARLLNFSSSVETNKRLQLLQPRPDQTVEVFDSESTKIHLTVLLEGDRQDVELEWTKDGKPLRNTTSKGECFDSLHSGVPECVGDFNHPAKYSVQVYDKSEIPRVRRSIQNFMKGDYYINPTEGYPKMHPLMEKQVFVVDGGDLNLTCRFKKPDLIIPELTVNGLMINFGSLENIAYSVADINQFQQKVMAPLNVAINPVMPKKGQTLVYTARNLKYKSRAHNGLSSTHYVECIGHRGDYTVRHPVRIQIVPRPIMAQNGIPSDSRYLSDGEQTFRCEVRNWAEIERLGVTLRRVWAFDNGTRVEGGPELKLGAQTVAVVIPKIVSCVLEMWYPASEAMRSWRGRILYNSSDDPELGAQLTAQIEVPISRLPSKSNQPAADGRQSPSERNLLLLVIILATVGTCLLLVAFGLFLLMRTRLKSTRRNNYVKKNLLLTDISSALRQPFTSDHTLGSSDLTCI